jgi:outer membrane biosynthesis protein TonB
MAPRALKSKGEDGTPEILKPKTEKAKVEKVKAVPKPKVKGEKTEKAAPKVTKPKVEKGEKAEKKEKSDGKGGEKGEKGGKEVKEKVKAVTGDEAAALIVEYLKVMNRPFSATEVSANLHGKVRVFNSFPFLSLEYLIWMWWFAGLRKFEIVDS